MRNPHDNPYLCSIKINDKMNRTLCILFTALLFCSCSGGKSSDNATISGDTLTVETSLLTIVDCGEYTIADVVNPWDTTQLLGKYILIDRNAPQPDNLPEGTIVKVPVRSSIVYSSVHAGAIEEIGAIDAITGVCDAQYYKMPAIVDRLKSGKIMDAGNSMSPSVERIVELSPEAILASPFQNAGHGAIEQLHIPIIECADYMETTPLARAEWIKLFGELYGNRAAADSIYRSVASRYRDLAQSALSVSEKPTVVSEMIIDGVWYVPGGRSYAARLFADAGADYPWSDDSSTGSLQLDFSAVYDRAHDADIWLIKTYGINLTLADLKASYSLNARMKAFSTGGVYASNTATASLFEDFPFHPDLLLKEYINIFHPGLLPDSTLRYFQRVE